MTDTLILNADATPLRWMPLSTKPWQDAVKIHFEGRVSIIEAYDTWVIRSPSVAMRVPAVAMVRDYVRPDYRVRLTKYTIKLRDDFTCQYCGQRFEAADLTIDHVVPVCLGGPTAWTNCVAACTPCNQTKAHRTGVRPRRQPARPSFGRMLELRRGHPLEIGHPSWLPYLGWPEHLAIHRPPPPAGAWQKSGFSPVFFPSVNFDPADRPSL
jgi:5-methylcytosine-specific restriction endonuclease McrA